MDLTNNIKAARTAKGLSQAEISRRLDLDPSAYYRLENRGKKLSLEHIEAIASALELSLIELLTYGQEKAKVSDEPVSNIGLSKNHTLRVEELEDRIKDKEFIIRSLSKDIEDIQNLFRTYLEYMELDISYKYRVGKYSYENKNGELVNAPMSSVSEEEANEMFLDGRHISLDIDEEDKEKILDLMFSDKEFSPIATIIMNTSFIEDQAYIRAYTKHKPHSLGNVPAFWIYELEKRDSTVYKIYQEHVKNKKYK